MRWVAVGRSRAGGSSRARAAKEAGKPHEEGVGGSLVAPWLARCMIVTDAIQSHIKIDHLDELSSKFLRAPRQSI